MARATSSLPVPDSPRMSTVVGVAATRTISSASSFILGFWPMMKSPSACAWISRSIIPYRSSSSSVRLRSASRSHMNLALAPPMTSVLAGFNRWIAACTSGLPVTSMIRSRWGSAMSSRRSVLTWMLRRRASSRPGAHGFTSTTPTMVTVGSPLNISSKARPPLPAPTMTTLVTFPEARLEGLGLALGEALEGGVLGDEGHLHLAGGAIALLADDHVRDPVAVLRLQPVALRAIEEEDDVGVLLERARLPQVRELGLLALAGLHCAGELGERHHRHVQLLGQRLQGARDLGDLLLPVLLLVAPTHELEVIDHDQVEPVLRLHAPGLGPRLQHGEGGRIVDVDGRLRQSARRIGETGPVARVEVTGAHLVRVHLGLGAEQPLHELLLGHLEAQHQHPLVVLHPGVLGDVQREGGLAHGGAPRDDDEVARLEARRHPVEIVEAGGEPGDVLLAVVELLDVLEGILQDGPHREGRPLHPPLGDLEDQPLRVVEQLVHVVPGLVALPDDVGGDADQVAQEGLLPDGGPVGEEVGRGGRLLHQAREGGGSPDLLQLRAPLQLLRDGEEVHRIVALEEREGGIEDLAVPFLVEVGRLEQLDGLGQALALQQDRPQDGPLRLQAVGRDLGGEQVGERGHGYSRLTDTFNWAVTSACRRTGTENSPRLLMGSSSPMRRRSSSIPCWARKAARSARPTEPKRRPSSEACRRWAKCNAPIAWAWLWASDLSLAACASWLALIWARFFMFAGVACRASFWGSRKLRA